jgi:hypothetical protein
MSYKSSPRPRPNGTPSTVVFYQHALVHCNKVFRRAASDFVAQRVRSQFIRARPAPAAAAGAWLGRSQTGSLTEGDRSKSLTAAGAN